MSTYAKAKFEQIYRDLKRKIENATYGFQMLLPSENILTEVYSCSRNTVRRAISALAAEGYVQSLHGIGVRVTSSCRTGSLHYRRIESFRESAARNPPECLHQSYLLHGTDRR